MKPSSKAAQETASHRKKTYAQMRAAAVHGRRHGGKVRRKCRVRWWLLHLEELMQRFPCLQHLGRGVLGSRVRNHFAHLKNLLGNHWLFRAGRMDTLDDGLTHKEFLQTATGGFAQRQIRARGRDIHKSRI